MKIDRDHFYKTVCVILFKDMAQSQVDGLNHLLEVWEEHYATYPLPFLAYCLATAYHETARTMRPIEEWGKGKGHQYGVWYGRGYVQLTWIQNYRRASERLEKIGIHVDLVANKDGALDPIVAAHVMYLGMIQGWFTGRKLADFIPSDPVNARRIINGLDKATEIAKYHAFFAASLRPEASDVQAP